jgi:UrcA family protein
MSVQIRTARAVALSVAAAAVTLAYAASAAEPVTEVIVEAPKVTHTGQKAAPLGASIDLASIRYRVTYGDLDLVTPGGAKALEERINDAAKRACKQLEDSLPPNSYSAPGDPPCVKSAVDGAMKQAREAIAAAGKKAAH